MILTISDIVDKELQPRISSLLEKQSWRDGKVTAGVVAKKVKRNQQADMSSAAGRKIAKELMVAISANSVLQAASRPRKISNLMISRTGEANYYGPHVDNAIMKIGDDRLRTDLSFTLFLSPADAYEGGELIIHAAGATQSLKGDQGDLILYPTSNIHEVSPVTAGERIVCVGWIESLVADASQRELLFDLENLRVSLRTTMSTQSAEMITLDKVIANLVRQWAVT
ncbi:Fe2+-dependent dioxygenase [Parasphingorhabdus litoris]|uniref:Fe2+-dependent dioxygenase n=1 Tax=Parasphingorhabdus litoris TaxID=394733 RepID=A0ABN1ALA7_9SPHN|nr:Fe2+-dependent dioxygenase [Parasphingorhabdus litoris]